MIIPIVLDTNCLLRCLSTKSPYHLIWSKIVTNEIALCISNEILCEYSEIILRFLPKPIETSIIRTILLSENTNLINPYYHFNLIEADPDDNKFVDCAIASQAAFLVTEDAHFNSLKHIPFPRINIMGLDEFLDYLMHDYS